GVIIKVEDVPKAGREQHRGKRLTINTAAVWSDWVRDQATVKPPTSTKDEAKEGANSIATKGEPVSPDTTVIVDVIHDTKVETRYRSATDEASEGARTPAGAARKESDPAADRSARKDREDKNLGTSKGPQFDAAKLQPGLFIDVEFHRVSDQNRAHKVVVLRPVGGPDTPAREAEPQRKESTNKRDR